VFLGLSLTLARVPELGRFSPFSRAQSFLSFLSVAQEGKGLKGRGWHVAFAPHSVRRSRAPTSIVYGKLIKEIKFG